MIKKILIIYLLCVGSASFSLAQSSESGTVEEMVDMSLEGLKGSYQKLSDRNRLLSSGIEGYRKHIQSLRQELDSLSEKATGKAFEQKKGELDTALEQSRRNLGAARLDVQTMREQIAGGAAMAQLKARRAQLQQQLAARQAGVKLESAKAYANRLDKEIAKLKSRQKELERNLSQSSQEKSLEIPSFTEESYQLRRRLVALYDENIRLKKEMFDLGTLAVSP